MKMRYRLKQVQDALSGKLTETDWSTINNSLSKKELILFHKLAIADQFHSMQVAKSALELKNKLRLNIDSKLITRAALLHDIGKLGIRLSLLDRVLPVIMTRISVKLSRMLGQKYSDKLVFRGFFIYWHHQYRGAEIALESGLEPQIVELIRMHQEPISEQDDKLLWLIKKADSLN